jgi:pimeloyl-ACP methyl ester carboxylesterase
MNYRDHTLTLRTLTFHVLDWGDPALDPARPPLVLLHGLTGHAHIWDRMAPTLADRRHVCAPDQRGHGDTSRALSYATQDFVHDLEALRQAWDLDTFDIMGLSMGGHNALTYAHAHPQRVRRLIVIDIPPKIDRRRSPDYDKWQRLAADGHTPFATFAAAMADARSGNKTAPDANLEHRTKWNLRETDAGLILKWDPRVQIGWDPEDLWPKLPEINTPTLLVRAGKTEYLTEHTAARMVAALPNADFAEVPESGHSIPTDAPELLLPIVEEWLSVDL